MDDADVPFPDLEGLELDSYFAVTSPFLGSVPPNLAPAFASGSCAFWMSVLFMSVSSGATVILDFS